LLVHVIPAPTLAASNRILQAVRDVGGRIAWRSRNKKAARLPDGFLEIRGLK